MRKNVTQEAAGFLAGARRRRIWLKVVSALGCVVVFCTTYALILPAITMEKTGCGLTEHTHTADCYTQVTAVTRQEPVCSLENLDLHEHTEDCFDENGTPVCGYADFVIHEHDASCYDADGRLWCPLPEIKAHTHSEDCYATLQTLAVHTHTDECYTTEQGELICTEATGAEQEPAESAEEAEPELICDQKEIMLHEHVSSCFDANGNLICGKTQVLEHVHSDACFETAEEAVDTEALTCGLTEGEGAHTHDDSCYDESGELVCQLEENTGHQHGPLCYGTWELTCGLQEHTHTEECRLAAELTEEEQAQVDEVIALIDALPTQAEIEEALTALEDAGDEDGYDAYLAEIVTQAKAAYEAYSALMEVQQEKVTNAAKLMALEPFWSVQVLPDENGGSTDPIQLSQYAAANEGKVEITVSDKEGALLEPDADGYYNVTAGETYNIRVVYEGDKLAKGKYYVAFPANIDLKQQNGDLTFKDNQGTTIDAGRWYSQKNEDGTVWLIFDITGDLSKHSDIILTADVTCNFAYTEEPIEFDGNINVKVHHNEDFQNTDVSKWAKDLNPEKPNKIEWRSEIYGNSGSNIIGATVTDTITTPDTHYFTEADKEAGIEFEATKYKPESSFTKENILETHSWTVRPSDQGLTWNETGWTYTMPETIVCTKCGKTITLGNDDWLYYIRYTSTMRDGLPEGYTQYENNIACDGANATGRTHTGATESDAGVVKTGRYVQNPDDGQNDNPYDNDVFEWTLTVDIPAARSGEKFDYFWYLWDSLRVQEGDQRTYWNNPLTDIKVTAEIGGETISVPQYGSEDALNAEICWRNPYTGDKDSGQQIDFYTECKCTEANCPRWKDGKCDDPKDQGFCRCWSYDKDVRITVIYSTPVGDLSETYGGRGAELVNSVTLNNKENDGTGFKAVAKSRSSDDVPIPGVFTKKLTGKPEEDNGLIAEYTITVNEAMADLSKLKELAITDAMSKTLNLIPSSLKIQYEGEDGVKIDLPAEQYTVSPVTEQETGGKKENVFTITLGKEALGPRKYTLTYHASVSGNEDVGLTYQNNASVTLFGQNYTVTGEVINVPQAAIGAKTYVATLLKQDANDRKPLNGAEFVLYAYVEDEDDLWLHSYTTADYTDANGGTHSGIVRIETLPAEGVILHPHTLYYVKETKAPEGYQLDDTLHYFWFCDDADGTTCEHAGLWSMSPYNATCIYSGGGADRVEDLTILNKAILGGHELPETGGSGTTLYTWGGLLLCGGAYLLYKHTKRRREGVPS